MEPVHVNIQNRCSQHVGSFLLFLQPNVQQVMGGSCPQLQAWICCQCISFPALAASDLTETPAFPAEENSQDETEVGGKTASDHKPEPQAGNTRRTIIEQAGEF